jgi:hypothetical protein
MSRIDRRACRAPLRRFAALLVTAAMLGLALLPAAAIGKGDPSQSQYNSTLEQISQGGSGDSSGAPPSQVSQVSQVSEGGGLPFTGLDVGVLLVVAVALGAAGVLLHRQSRRAPGGSAG